MSIINSLKKRPSSDRSGNFGQLNLFRKQRIGRGTNNLEILYHAELITGKKNRISMQKSYCQWKWD